MKPVLRLKSSRRPLPATIRKSLWLSATKSDSPSAADFAAGAVKTYSRIGSWARAAVWPAAGELLLDVAYKLKTAEGILPAGSVAGS